MLVIWVAYGAWMATRRPVDRSRLRGIPRTRRGVVGSALFFVAMIVFLGGLFALTEAKLLLPTGFTPLGWALTCALGLTFVHLQMVGFAYLLSVVLDDATPGESKRP